MATDFFEMGHGTAAIRIACQIDGPRIDEASAAAPVVLWCNGFRSTMDGSKAEAAAGWARADGFSLVRFDYSGHGQSGGAFADGTIGLWAAEALAVFERYCAAAREVVIVGSSMGGWIGLLVALALKKKKKDFNLKGLVLIAPAPDFIEKLIEPSLDAEDRAQLATVGRIAISSGYNPDDPMVITREMIEDGRRNSLLDQPILFDRPVRILHGRCDRDVPWHHALRLLEVLPACETTLTLVPDGDHRLSRPEDLDRIRAMLGRALGWALGRALG